ncbi:MAG: hypothetical protein EB833_00275 [Thaumarchaeota archaeon S13]|nr:MAG: hypothetical protein EB833_00275 [Thaumarchaeota archaeon S13]
MAVTLAASAVIATGVVAVSIVTLDGVVESMVGPIESLIQMRWLHVSSLPDLSVAVHRIVSALAPGCNVGGSVVSAGLGSTRL